MRDWDNGTNFQQATNFSWVQWPVSSKRFELWSFYSCFTKPVSSEFPDVLFSRKKSISWPFWKSFGRFCFKKSGNSVIKPKKNSASENTAFYPMVIYLLFGVKVINWKPVGNGNTLTLTRKTGYRLRPSKEEVVQEKTWYSKELGNKFPRPKTLYKEWFWFDNRPNKLFSIASKRWRWERFSSHGTPRSTEIQKKNALLWDPYFLIRHTPGITKIPIWRYFMCILARNFDISLLCTEFDRKGVFLAINYYSCK